MALTCHRIPTVEGAITEKVMEGLNQWVGRPVNAAATHCRRQKPMGSHYNGGVSRIANDARACLTLTIKKMLKIQTLSSKFARYLGGV